MKSAKTKRLTVSAIMLALSTVLAIVCAYIPFLNFQTGGGFTIASMLPVVVVAYMYGMRWGVFTSLCYSAIQIILSLTQGSGGTVMALLLPNSESFMGYLPAIVIILLDYIVAYGVLFTGGIFRGRIKNKTLALTLGVVVALSLRYLVHIISGAIFYGAWAEWFFSDVMIRLGEVVLDTFSGWSLSLVYSIAYNGCYMIPEIIITAVLAVAVSRIPQIKIEE